MRSKTTILLTASLICATGTVFAGKPHPASHPRYGAQALWANGKVHWFGGYGSTVSDGRGASYWDNRQAGHSVYDPATDVWVSSKWDGTGPAAIDNSRNGIVGVGEGSWVGTSQSFVYDDDGDGTEEIFQHVGYPDTARELWRYDPDTDAWTVKASNTHWAGHRRGVAAFDAATATLYMHGGASPAGLKGFGKYSFTTNTYTDFPDAPVGAQWQVGAVINGKLYIAGGEQNGVSFSTAIWEVDLSTDPPTWSATPVGNLLTGVNYPGMAVYDDRMYIVGGRKSDGPVKDIQVFDPVSRVTTKLGDLPVAVHGCAAVIDPATGTLYFGAGSEYKLSQYGGPINTDWRKTNVNITPLVWADIADDPAYFPYRDWFGNLVTGTVNDSDGFPVAGAAIGIKLESQAGADALTTKTTSYGEYVTTDIYGDYSTYVPDNARLAAWKQGWRVTQDRDTGLVDGQDAVIDFTLSEPVPPNIAVGRPVVASSQEAPNAPSRAVDGDMDTRWASDPAAGASQYLIIDLGADTSVNGLTIYWERARALNYKIDALPASAGDPLSVENWAEGAYATVYSVTDTTYSLTSTYSPPTGGIWISTLPWIFADPLRFDTPVVARGLRMSASKFLGSTNYSIWELEVNEQLQPVGSIAEAKSLADGTSLAISGKIVTAAQGAGGVPAGVLYMEEPERFAGIRVVSDTPVAVGNSVTVSGTMATTPSGERYINATSVIVASGTPLRPLAAPTRVIAETAMMEGLLVRAAGAVRTVASDYYTISDGYYKDGLEVETKVVTGTAPTVSVGEFVAVTGIASRESGRVILAVP